MDARANSKLSPARRRLVDDVYTMKAPSLSLLLTQSQNIALYCCHPTVECVKRNTPDCVYDDQFVYANNRYNMAEQ